VDKRYDWCKTCGELANLERHRCPPMWLGWFEDNDELEACENDDEREEVLRDVATQVHANTDYMAADAFAKKCCAQDPEAFEQFEEGIHVVCIRRTVGDQTIHRFRVSAAMVAEFYPLKIGDKPAT